MEVLSRSMVDMASLGVDKGGIMIRSKASGLDFTKKPVSNSFGLRVGKNHVVSLHKAPVVLINFLCAGGA